MLALHEVQAEFRRAILTVDTDAFVRSSPLTALRRKSGLGSTATMFSPR